MSRKSAKKAKKAKKPAVSLTTSEVDETPGEAPEPIEEPEVAAAPAALGVVLNPKMRKIEPQIEVDGRVRRIRLDNGKLYRLPAGLKWHMGKKPVGVLEQPLPPGGEVCDLDDLSPDRVSEHRLFARGPVVAAARALVAKHLGPVVAAGMDRRSPEALVAAANKIIKTTGDGEPLSLVDVNPPDPKGVSDIPQAMQDVLFSRLSPPAPVSIEDEVFEALDEDAL